MESRMSNRKLSLIIAFVYVVLGTFYSYYAINNMISDGIIYYIFFPVSFLPQLILFTERDPFVYILICQTITLAITSIFLWFFISIVRANKKQVSDKHTDRVK